MVGFSSDGVAEGVFGAAADGGASANETDGVSLMWWSKCCGTTSTCLERCSCCSCCGTAVLAIDVVATIGFGVTSMEEDDWWFAWDAYFAEW